jgi:hypothetical protein
MCIKLLHVNLALTKAEQGNTFLNMSSVVRRVLKEVAREYPGEKHARLLIRWVNNSNPRDTQHYYPRDRITAASRNRVVFFLEHLQGLITRIEASTQEDLELDPPGDISILERLVNDQLQQYLSTTSFEIYGREWAFEEVISGNRPAGEWIAIRSIVELAKLKLLDRIRRCTCGDWLYARFSHQHFCRPACRHRHYESSQEFKVQRRDYMRRYYRLKKSGKVK